MKEYFNQLWGWGLKVVHKGHEGDPSSLEEKGKHLVEFPCIS